MNSDRPPSPALRASVRTWSELICALLVLAPCGCTAARLKQGFTLQASTLSEMQYQQVLDNLAMFSCNPHSLAWHIRLNGGVVQVADQGQYNIGANLGGPGYVAPNLGFGRNVLHQWNVDPVIDADDLDLLQLAYRKAINPFDADGAIKREAYDRISEFSAGYHIALTHEVAMDMIETMKIGAKPERQEKLARIKGDLHDLYQQIAEISEKPQEYQPEAYSAGPHAPPTKLEFLKEEVIRLTSEVADESVEPVGAYYRPGRNVGLIEQTQDKIEAILKLVDEGENGEPNPYSLPWLRHTCCKDDVPKCVCLVGRYRECGQECYVWIEPESMKTFRDFVLIILSLAPADAMETTNLPGVGAANSPNF